LQEEGYVPVICGMGRTVFKDLERTRDVDSPAALVLLCVFVLAGGWVRASHLWHRPRTWSAQNTVDMKLLLCGCRRMAMCQ
jgi:hypothetical protein